MIFANEPTANRYLLSAISHQLKPTTLDTALSLTTPAVKGDLEAFNGFAFTGGR